MRGVHQILFRVVIPLGCVSLLLILLGVIFRESLRRAEVGPTEDPARPATPPPSYEQLKGQYLEMVTSGIEKLKKFNPAKYRGHEGAVRAELTVFQAWALLINEMPHYPLAETEKQVVRSLARRLSLLQKRELPAMREEWTRCLRASLKRYHVIASCSDEGNKSLMVICPPGSGKQAVSECLTALQGEAARQLRFEQVRFTFTDGVTLTADVSPSRSTGPLADDLLLYWRDDVHERVEW
jgi:hypothetical protein